MNQALLEHSTAVQTFDGDEKELTEFIQLLISDCKLSEDEDGRLFIFTETSNKAETKRIVEKTVELINSRVKDDLFLTARSNLVARGLSHELRLKDIKAQSEALNQVYTLTRNRSLTLLREQAKIARKLGLKNPFTDMTSADGKTNFIGSDLTKLSPFENRYFLHGYEAIEQQIANVLLRKDDDLRIFVSFADNLVMEQALIEAQNVETILLPLLKNTPLTQPEFRIVITNVNYFSFEALDNSKNTILLATFFGFLLSLLYVLYKYATLKRMENTALTKTP